MFIKVKMDESGELNALVRFDKVVAAVERGEWMNLYFDNDSMIQCHETCESMEKAYRQVAMAMAPRQPTPPGIKL